jgi:hypothetical protein
MGAERIFRAQHPLQPTRRNEVDLTLQMRSNAIPIYQTHPAGG